MRSDYDVTTSKGIYDEFVEKAAAAAKARTVGAGWEEGAQQGTQVSKEQVDIIMGYIESGKKEGARLVAGGNRVGDKGYFLEPTVFADVDDEMTIAKEEIFGPVMSIMKFKTAEEAIARANATEYGLGAAVFTKDFQKARATVNKIRAGTVWVNCYDTFDAALPFGGFKASGIGRELGEAGLRPYLETKTVVYN
jgi:aldehyde dehydrogenase (NAD+)